jgi:hypothetical protein
MSETLKDKKNRLLAAAEKGVDELIKVLEEPIITNAEEDLSADKLKNAAQAKKLAFLDAIEMLQKIQQERDSEDAEKISTVQIGKQGFAEGRAKGGK